MLTWNRVALLREAVESLLRQEVLPCRIVVIDNASTDETPDFVKQTAKRNPQVQLIRQAVHVDFCANMLTAINAARTDYFMIMHDDDILDRSCIAYMNAILSKDRDISMICSAQRPFSDSCTCAAMQEDHLTYEVFHSKADFVAADFARFLNRQEDSMCFPSILYKKDCVSTEVLRRNLFGKMVDKPFVYDSMGYGGIARLETPLYNYRVHGGQDTSTSANGPYPQEILNLLAAQRRILANDRFYCRFFEALSIRLMKSLYFWGGNPKDGWCDFLKDARKLSLTSSVFDKPWRIPFWRNHSRAICKKLLKHALERSTQRTVCRDWANERRRK